MILLPTLTAHIKYVLIKYEFCSVWDQDCNLTDITANLKSFGIILYTYRTYCMPTSSEIKEVLDLFSDLLIVHQLHDPLNDVINYHHKRYLRQNYQLHTMFKTWETREGAIVDLSLYACCSKNSVLPKG